jgi:hypothetical protein
MGIKEGKKYKYLENKYYLRYDKLKQKIKDKYDDEIFVIPEGYKWRDNYPQEHREQYKKYLAEVADLIFKPKGWYQKFTWDIMSGLDKQLMERRARGVSHTPKEL